MRKNKNKKMEINKFLFWTPRVLTILFAVFISLFALDVFAAGYGFWEAVGGFLIHLVPTYLLVIALVIAWKWEHIGGIIFILLGLWYVVMVWDKLPVSASWMAVISGSAFLIGALFIICWAKKKAKR